MVFNSCMPLSGPSGMCYLTATHSSLCILFSFYVFFKKKQFLNGIFWTAKKIDSVFHWSTTHRSCYITVFFLKKKNRAKSS